MKNVQSLFTNDKIEFNTMEDLETLIEEKYNLKDYTIYENNNQTYLIQTKKIEEDKGLNKQNFCKNIFENESLVDLSLYNTLKCDDEFISKVINNLDDYFNYVTEQLNK